MSDGQEEKAEVEGSSGLVAIHARAAYDAASGMPFVQLDIFGDDGNHQVGEKIGKTILNVDDATMLGLSVLRMAAGAIMVSMANEYRVYLRRNGNSQGAHTITNFLEWMQDNSRHDDENGDGVE